MRHDLDVDPWDHEEKARDLSSGSLRFFATVIASLALLAIAGAF